MAFFTQRTSIHGRRIGLSSTGGITSSPSGSTDIDRAAQMWGPGLLETSTGGTLSNAGTSVVSTAVTANTTFTLPAPISGLYKEVFCGSSANILVTVESTDAGITFVTDGNGTAAGSSAVVFGSTTTGAAGKGFRARAASTALWLTTLSS